MIGHPRIRAIGKRLGTGGKRTLWLAVAGLAGMVCNLLIWVWLVWPLLQVQQELVGRQSDLEARKRMLAVSPVPEKFTPEDIARMSREVPEEEGDDAFLLMLDRLEAESGVVITKLTKKGGNAGSREPKDNGKKTGTERAGILSGSFVNMAQDKPEGGNRGPVGNNGQDKKRQLQTQSVELQLTGTYGQIEAFLEKLQSMERLVVVQQWQMSAIEKRGSDQRMQMTLDLILFTAPSPSAQER